MKARTVAELSCVSFQEWTSKRAVATLGSNAGSLDLPFQSWRRFKEAFTPEIVERALIETPGTIRHLADPFGGSGTAALAAQFFGVQPTTIEVNPFLADLIEAKLASYDLDHAATTFGKIMQTVFLNAGTSRPIFPGAPKTFVEPGLKGRYIFSKAVAQRLLAYRRAIDEVTEPTLRRLFLVILASVAIPVSNVTISGKGRRYRRGWANGPTEPALVDQLFHKGILAALHDIRRFGSRRCCEYQVIRGDARRLIRSVGPCDLAVFSPPYPNSFDYTDVYNVELWVLGYLNGREANTQLRNATLRSHVQILRDMTGDPDASPTLSQTVKELRHVQGQLWNRHIPDMIVAYFADMKIILAGLAANLRTRGRVYMVVGDSRYSGVHIPVATILAEIAPVLGYEVCNLEPFRSMRASPQQGGRPELAETLVVLERV